jgi:hypothetical protein
MTRKEINCSKNAPVIIMQQPKNKVKNKNKTKRYLRLVKQHQNNKTD